MKYTEFSKRAQADLADVLQYLRETGQELAKLPAAMQANSPVTDKHLSGVLDCADFSDAPQKIKQRAGMLSAYIANPDDGYGRDRQAERASMANRLAGRTSTRESVNLPDHLLEWWLPLTPIQRGDFLAAAQADGWIKPEPLD